MRSALAAVLALNAAAALAASKEAPAADAKAVYAKSCASCHGKDGKGNPAMAKALKAAPGALDLVDAESLAKKDEELGRLTAEGKGKMPAYKAKLKPEEISALVAHIRTLAPKPAKAD